MATISELEAAYNDWHQKYVYAEGVRTKLDHVNQQIADLQVEAVGLSSAYDNATIVAETALLNLQTVAATV